MSKTTSASTAIAVVALVLGAAALAVNFGIPGPQGPAGAPGATGAQGPAGERGPVGVGLTPTVQKLQIEMGEGEIVQAAVVDQATGETRLVSEEMGGEETLTGEYHRWQPYVLVVKEGDTVELTVVNPRKNAHSFVLNAFGVDTGRIPGRVEQPDLAGRTLTVTFVADKAGVFKFECAIEHDHMLGDCDADHERMVGYLVVLGV